MASMRDIKRRKQSVSSTQQITKAMKIYSKAPEGSKQGGADYSILQCNVQHNL